MVSLFSFSFFGRMLMTCYAIVFGIIIRGHTFSRLVGRPCELMRTCGVALGRRFACVVMVALRF